MADKDRGGRVPSSSSQDPAPEAEEIARYEQILAKDPSSLVFPALAEAYRRRKMLDRAIAVCRRGLHHHPDFVSGRVALACAYVDRGEKELARKELERVVLLSPDNLKAQKLLLRIYRERGDLGHLEKTVHRILSLDPGDEETKRTWGWLRASLQRPASPTPLRSNRARGIVTKTLAEIYASQGYCERALAIYRELSLREPDNPDFHQRLADLKQSLLQKGGRTRGKAGEGEAARH